MAPVLDATDLDYEVVTSTDAFSSSLPAVTPDDDTRLFSLTERDVILATPEVNVLAAESGVFDTSLRLDIAGMPIPVVRGWNWADVEVNGQQFRFVNTHPSGFRREPGDPRRAGAGAARGPGGHPAAGDQVRRDEMATFLARARPGDAARVANSHLPAALDGGPVS